MNVAPAAAYELVVDWGVTGATIGARIIDNEGATSVARVTGFVEYPAGSGVYQRAGNVAPDTQGQYTVVYDDDGGTAAVGHVATDDLTVTGSAPLDPVPPADIYGTVDELFRRLKIRNPTSDQTAAAERIMAAASTEVNLKMGRSTDLQAGELALATEATLERGAELWNESEVPFGAIGLDSPTGPVFVSRNSRALAKLGRIQESWGVG